MNNERSIEEFRITGHQAVGQLQTSQLNDNFFDPRWRDDVYDEKAKPTPFQTCRGMRCMVAAGASRLLDPNI